MNAKAYPEKSHIIIPGPDQDHVQVPGADPEKSHIIIPGPDQDHVQVPGADPEKSHIIIPGPDQDHVQVPGADLGLFSGGGAVVSRSHMPFYLRTGGGGNTCVVLLT